VNSGQSIEGYRVGLDRLSAEAELWMCRRLRWFRRGQQFAKSLGRREWYLNTVLNEGKRLANALISLGKQYLHDGLGCVRSLVLRRVAVGFRDSSSSRASLASAPVSFLGVWEIIGSNPSSFALSSSTGDCAGTENVLVV